MKTDLLNINVRAGANGKVAELSLLANDTKSIMDVLHGAVVEVGRWMDMSPNTILGVLVSVIATDEYEERKATKSLGEQEKGGDREDGPADLRPGQGPAHHAGEGAGEVDKKG